jgi:hypothetical protein
MNEREWGLRGRNFEESYSDRQIGERENQIGKEGYLGQRAARLGFCFTALSRVVVLFTLGAFGSLVKNQTLGYLTYPTNVS